MIGNFTDLTLKIRYRTSDTNMVNDFFIPVLNNSILYKRAVGYFSSTSLIELLNGILKLIKNNGKILLIASPNLTEEDIEAIKKGYEKKYDIIEQRLLNSFYEPKNYFETEKLNILANLISQNILEIKIAYIEDNNEIGLYHEKIGLFYDMQNNIIAFNGSVNETASGFTHNFESFDVFCSWKKSDEERVNEKEKDFDLLWNNETNRVKVINFSQALILKILSYKKNDIDFKNYTEKKENVSKNYFFNKPDYLKLYNYQLEAIKNWKENNYIGIFNMATGTGKTLTALAGISELSKELNENLGIIIVCPYQHLVEQWVDDIVKFNVKPIIGYSTSEQKNWKNILEKTITNFNLGIKKSFCFITTNASYISEPIQKQLNKLKGNILIVVDEAHNFGAFTISQKLNYNFKYRLALSATLERYNDIEGTETLLKYFEKKCIEYSLKEAIDEKKLTEYYYYPILTYLSDDEYNEYKRISKEIAKCYLIEKNGKKQLSDKGKFLLIKRARLVGGAYDKLIKLKQCIIENNYKNDTHILIYCGSSNLYEDNINNDVDLNDDIRQIDAVVDLLGNQLNMNVAKFTSQENINERKVLKEQFTTGTSLQALVAIKCLDEGVNIPKIKTAFILASNSNPKEYIQRRGRLLRLYEGKDYAKIFDFIALPRKLEDVKNTTETNIKYDISLIKKEILRIEDFALLAINSYEGKGLIDKLKELYNLKFNKFDYEVFDE